MPSEEMTKIILSNIMEENWVIKLSPSEVELIKKLSRAAEIMHMFHDRQFKNLSESLNDTDKHAIFWNKNTQVILDSDIKLDKNFLDPWTLFSLFTDYDFSNAKWISFTDHLEKRLEEFLQDPKNESHKEERELMLKILKLTWVIMVWSKVDNVMINKTKIPNEKDFILPSESSTIILWTKASSTPPPIEWENWWNWDNHTWWEWWWEWKESDFDNLLQYKELSLILNNLTRLPWETMWRFINIQRMEYIFEGLSRLLPILDSRWNETWRFKEIKIPDSEKERLMSVAPIEFWSTEQEKIKNMTENTEWDLPPILVQFPKTILINWTTTLFTLKLLYELVNEACERDSSLQWSYYNPSNIKHPNLIYESDLYDWKLRAYASNITKNSRERFYNDQVKHQKEVFWSNAKVNQWMWGVLMMRMLDTHFSTIPPWSSQERLIKDWWMRLNVLSDDHTEALYVKTDKDSKKIHIDFVRPVPDTFLGFGGCLVFEREIDLSGI